MELIVAVYDDWGIGKDGSQPIALSADRKFFREITKGATVIVGRKTLADFPGGRPLPNRINVVLTRQVSEIPGATICHSTDEAVAINQNTGRTIVIGGGSIYHQLLPYCHTAYVTRIHAKPESDTFFPNLDEDPQWQHTQILHSGSENGINYEMYVYQRKN